MSDSRLSRMIAQAMIGQANPGGMELYNPPIPGLIDRGNIDLYHRPVVENPSEPPYQPSISTVRSMSTGFDEGEVLLPTVSDDARIVSGDEAVDNYLKTGKHLGVFNTPQNATDYAQRLHEDQARLYRK